MACERAALPCVTHSTSNRRACAAHHHLGFLGKRVRDDVTLGGGHGTRVVPPATANGSQTHARFLRDPRWRAVGRSAARGLPRGREAPQRSYVRNAVWPRRVAPRGRLRRRTPHVRDGCSRLAAPRAGLRGCAQRLRARLDRRPRLRLRLRALLLRPCLAAGAGGGAGLPRLPRGARAHAARPQGARAGVAQGAWFEAPARMPNLASAPAASRRALPDARDTRRA